MLNTDADYAANFWLSDRERPIKRALMRFCGVWAVDKGLVRARWGEVSRSHLGLAFKIGCYEQAHLHLHLLWLSAFLYLPFLTRALSTGYCSMENPGYGFSWSAQGLHIHWGKRTKVVWNIWQAHNVRNEYLDHDGNWRPIRIGLGADRDVEAPRWEIVRPYHYMLDDGDVQHVTATVHRERREWRWEWFGRGPISRTLRRLQPWKRVEETISVEFDDEVGAARGSWKGGCVGCGYVMKPGETPEHTLNRMQRERRFR